MPKWLRWLILFAILAAGVGIAYLVFVFVFLDFLVNLWWFDSKDYEAYYILRLTYRYLIFGAVVVFFFLIFFLNFWIASRFLGLASGYCEPREFGRQKRFQRLLIHFQTGSMKVYTPLSFLLAIPIAIPFYEKWEQGLLFFFGYLLAPGSGVADPAYGRDITYYLFAYPIYTFLQWVLLITFSILFLALLFLYFAENRLLCPESTRLPKRAKIHLTLIGVVVILLQTWWFYLESIGLLYTDSHMPRFFGPGFIEMRIILPLIWASMVTFLAAAGSAIYFIHRRRGFKFMLGSVALLLLMLGLRHTTVLTSAVQNYWVLPNEAVRERPFIENSIEATLKAFRLDQVETRDYEIVRNPEYKTNLAVQETLHNVPVWDRELLGNVYNQLQGFRPYYEFPNVDVDRYTVEGVYQQVYLSARELNTEKLPPSAQESWVNSRLQYTHGYGVVMTPAVQGGDEPITWFIRDIPIQSDFGVEVGRPGIYYGEGNYQYVIAPNEIGEIDHPQGNTNILSDYTGGGGVRLNSILRKILFAFYFGDRNIFFTTKTDSESRIIFRQNFVQAIQIITPFFLLEDDPYIVTTSDGLFWIQDAYTFSDYYPYAQPYDTDTSKRMFGDLDFNYIRNSVKIVVDAYNGDIRYYISNPTDPIVQAYRRTYPGLLKSMDEMPRELRKHVRYPQQYFTVQMSMFSRYHQINPILFYQEEDDWEFIEMNYGPLLPYYLTLNLLNPEKQEFILVSPMSPTRRDNLRSLVIVGCDEENYGDIFVYSFPKGEQIFGPAQIIALINQDTAIAQELTLWDQAGSRVIFGKMIVLPIGDSILYVQPIYLESAYRLKIPELRRIIVSQGDLVVMDRTLEEALRKLDERLTERFDRIRKRPGIQEARDIPMEKKPREEALEEMGELRETLQEIEETLQPGEGEESETEGPVEQGPGPGEAGPRP
ncbi:MAG: UPF0182 family protein [Desulfococcaceae bacterium]